MHTLAYADICAIASNLYSVMRTHCCFMCRNLSARAQAAYTNLQLFAICTAFDCMIRQICELFSWK